MKVLFEASLTIQDYEKSQFIWLRNKNNLLFIIEDGKRMRTLSTDVSPGKELQSTTLTETRTCTSLSWNKDGTLLAMIVDKRQIYFWEIQTNNFTHYKPISKMSTISTGKQNKTKEVELIEWSKVTNKLVICYSTGQLLLCNCDANLSERFIDSSDGVLKRVSWIESSSYADMFVCITVISEMLVMTFDGESRFYVQRDDFAIIRAKLSPTTSSQILRHNLKERQFSRPQTEEYLWLAYSTTDGKLLFKKISLQNYSLSEMNSRVDLAYSNENIDSQLVEFHWLNSTHLIACLSSGIVELIKIKSTNSINGQPMRSSLVNQRMIDINHEEELSTGAQPNQVFRSFELMASKAHDNMNINSSQQQGSSLSLATISNYKLFYYEIVEVDHQNTYALEKVDDLNLTGSLSKLKLELERVKWCFDCSMLAVQLNNGHILVYRTRLQDYIVSLHRSRAAYLSGCNEITILNYGPQLSHQSDHGDNELNSSNHKADSQEEVCSTVSESNNALVINVEFKPSIIAIGPMHLAVALNNRIQFYSVSFSCGNSELKRDRGLLVDEQEYLSIVVSISLNSHFVAVLFDDGRLKLHAIQSNKLTNDDPYSRLNNSALRCPASQNLFDSDERFFPDPTEPEQISAFILTEDLLLYCTQQCNMNVFSIKDWNMVQSCHHLEHFKSPILKLRANEQGNKFICILAKSTNEDDNVFLYDLYNNQIIRFIENDLFSKIFASQLIVHLPKSAAQLKLNKLIVCPPSTTTNNSTITKTKPSYTNRKFGFGRIMDAIWDGDGKTVLLIEQKCIHIFISLDHTLEREDTLVWYVKSVTKASSYTVLYASQGIVSFQTALGRVINSILDSHDDEPKLVKLEQQIAVLREKITRAVEGKDMDVGSDKSQQEELLLEAQAEVMSLKIEYLKSVLPIYPLTKCKEICEHLMSEEVFNLVPSELGGEKCLEIELVIWRQLAAWSLFTMNLNFASLIYRKHGLMLCAHVLRQIIRDALNKRLDAKSAVKTRLLVLLGCDI